MTRTYPGKKKKAANPYTPEKPNFDPDNQAMGYDSVPKGSKKRSLKAAEEYESDGGFVANDNGDEDAPKSKKPKTTAAKGKSAIAGAKKGGDDQGEFWEVRLHPYPPFLWRRKHRSRGGERAERIWKRRLKSKLDGGNRYQTNAASQSTPSKAT